jgi:hypothetical protein
MKCFFFKILILSIIILINTACKDLPDEPLILEYPVNEQQELLIISPSDGDVFKSGDLLKLRWLSSTSLSEVDIYLIKNNNIERTFVLNRKNNGTFGWFIDDNMVKSNNYSIKIVNSFEEMDFDISDRFSIRDEQDTKIKVKP